MKQVVLDFETMYDQEYSLRKMTPVEYIKDPRFEVIGCAVKVDGGAAFWLEEQELRDYLFQLPAEVAVVSHNALFDMCILAWRFDYIPALMIDTLGMARAWVQHRLRSCSLASVASHLQLPDKGSTVHKVVGMGRDAIKAAGFWDEYASYSCNDADLCWQIYRRFVEQGFPVAEILVMDTVLRACICPKFVADQEALLIHLNEVQQSKQSLLDRCGLASRDMLMSNDQFAAALRLLGVDPPTKISAATGNETYAFAKTDPDFLELEEHDNPDVQALVTARLGLKSTIEETRTQRLIAISQLPWPGNIQALLPIPLRYSGAHTHRLSGDWKINLQNLSRGGNIRKAVKAPPGRKVVAVDSSQVEARLAAWFCGEEKLIRAFAKNEDVYSSFASGVFGYPVAKATHPVERWVGKTGILSLQFGVGWEKFQRTVALQSKAQVGQEIVLSDQEAQNTVNTYRRTYAAIPRMWRKLDSAIPAMTHAECHTEIHPVEVLYEKIKLPSGLFLYYHNLENRDGEWVFTFAGKPKHLYGAKLLENIIQSLARIVVMNAAIEVRRKLKTMGLEKDIWLNLQVHDELIYVVPDELAPVVKRLVLHEMCVRPTWGQTIPLAAEGAIGQSYGEAK